MTSQVPSLIPNPSVVANEGQRIDIPDGCILENRLLSGNLNMIVRYGFQRKVLMLTLVQEL